MYPQQRPKEYLFSDEEEENIYTKEGRAKQVDDDAMAGWEDGFVLGVEEAFQDVVDEDELKWLDEAYQEENI